MSTRNDILNSIINSLKPINDSYIDSDSDDIIDDYVERDGPYRHVEENLDSDESESDDVEIIQPVKRRKKRKRLIRRGELNNSESESESDNLEPVISKRKFDQISGPDRSVDPFAYNSSDLSDSSDSEEIEDEPEQKSEEKKETNRFEDHTKKIRKISEKLSSGHGLKFIMNGKTASIHDMEFNKQFGRKFSGIQFVIEDETVSVYKLTCRFCHSSVSREKHCKPGMSWQFCKECLANETKRKTIFLSGGMVRPFSQSKCVRDKCLTCKDYKEWKKTSSK